MGCGSSSATGRVSVMNGLQWSRSFGLTIRCHHREESKCFSGFGHPQQSQYKYAVVYQYCSSGPWFGCVSWCTALMIYLTKEYAVVCIFSFMLTVTAVMGVHQFGHEMLMLYCAVLFSGSVQNPLPRARVFDAPFQRTRRTKNSSTWQLHNNCSYWITESFSFSS